MSPTEKGWDDVPFDIFDAPAPTPERVKTKKEEADAATKITYRRYRSGNHALCDPCTAEHKAGQAPGIQYASYQRLLSGTVTYLCFRHKQEAVHRDQLAGNVPT